MMSLEIYKFKIKRMISKSKQMLTPWNQLIKSSRITRIRMRFLKIYSKKKANNLKR